jgi:hypothetical protein
MDLFKMIKKREIKGKLGTQECTPKNLQRRFLLGAMFFVFGIFLVGFISAEIGTSYCCERTLDDQWCQDVDTLDQCDVGGDYTSPQPTACASTSYCSLGTCLDMDEGLCTRNTAKRDCIESEGLWRQESPEDIAQCQLGCCFIGSQASFITGIRCNKMATLYGLNLEFREDIRDEVECILSSRADVMGACVFDEEFTRTCQMKTREECDEMMASSEATEVSFHEDYLCTAPELQTNCEPSSETTCVEGKDEVYFLDTCKNIANIYDEEYLPPRGSNSDYWRTIYSKSESCAFTGIDNCGNCDYYDGHTCSEERGKSTCGDLNCEFEGETYIHGETWCAFSNPTTKTKGVNTVFVDDEGIFSQVEFDVNQYNTPGSRYFRMVCYNGDVTVEPCADFRQEVCMQSKIENERTLAKADVTGRDFYLTSACRINRWQDCVFQNNEGDCENTDRRDCYWFGENNDIMCAPLFTPGLKFWSDDETAEGTDEAPTQPTQEAGTPTEAEQICGLANTQCTANYVGKLWDVFGWNPDTGQYGSRTSGTECFDKQGKLKQVWLDDKREYTKVLGDCGIKTNYIGQEGFGTVAEDNTLSKEDRIKGMGF